MAELNKVKLGETEYTIPSGNGGSGEIEYFSIRDIPQNGSYTFENGKTWNDICNAVISNKDVRLKTSSFYEGEDIYESLILVGYDLYQDGDDISELRELRFSNARNILEEKTEFFNVTGKGFIVTLRSNNAKLQSANCAGNLAKENIVPRMSMSSSGFTIENNYSYDYNDYADAFSVSESENGVYVGAQVYGEPTMEVELASVDYVNTTVSTNYYTKAETDNIIATINSFDIVPVTTLPTENIRTDCIYIVKDSLVENDLFSEYIYVEDNGVSKWERFGSATMGAESDTAVDAMIADVFGGSVGTGGDPGVDPGEP